VLAWGAVRNTERIREESSDDVIRRLNDGLTFLNKNGVNRTALMEKIILTPACGCAGLAVSDATEVYRTLSELESKDF
jgi:hypothetical protein